MNKRKPFIFRCMMMSLGITLWASDISGSQWTSCNEDNPNHYILLIDASGSIVENNKKESLYTWILKDELPKRLYQTGFSSIRPFNPGKDFLSLFHLGITTGRVEEAHTLLKSSNLLTDLVHPRFILQQNVSSETLNKYIFPGIYYRLSFIELAKCLILPRLMKEALGMPLNFTYLIIVHDGKFNNHLWYKEADLIESGDKENVAATKKVVSEINNNYLFSDGKGKAGPVLRNEFESDDAPIFLDVYQIISISQQEWVSGLSNLKPFSKLDFKWTNQRDEKPGGMLKISLDEEFLNHINKYHPSTVSVTIDVDKNSISVVSDFKPIIDIPVVLPTPLPHDPLDYRVTLDIPIVHPDKLLGRQVVRYKFQDNNKIPIPPRYTTGYWYWLRWVILIALGVILFFIRQWYCKSSYASILINLPGKTFPIAVKLGEEIEGSTSAHPVPGACAFSIILPCWFKQWLCYRRMEIKFDSGDELNGSFSL